VVQELSSSQDIFPRPWPLTPWPWKPLQQCPIT